MRGASEHELYAEQLGTSHDERQIEAVQIVILDHVRIDRAHALGETYQQLRLGSVTASAGNDIFRGHRLPLVVVRALAGYGHLE